MTWIAKTRAFLRGRCYISAMSMALDITASFKGANSYPEGPHFALESSPWIRIKGRRMVASRAVRRRG